MTTDSGTLKEIRKHKDRAQKATAKSKFDVAISEYTAAARLDPSDLSVQQNLAHLLRRTGKTEPAKKIYHQLVKHYHDAGFLLKAIAIAKILIEMDPGEKETENLLQELHTIRAAKSPPAVVLETNIRPQSPEPETEADTKPLRGAPLFNQLGDDELDEVVKQMELVQFAGGEPIIEEGSLGDSLYILVSGMVSVRRTSDAGVREVARMREGAFFGEIGLLCNTPRIASVVSLESCDILVLSKKGLGVIVKKYPYMQDMIFDFCKARLINNLLRSSPLFRMIPETGIKKLLPIFKFLSVDAGTTLLKQGTKGERFVIILRGECEASREVMSGISDHYPPMREGDFFGEISIINNTPITANVVTKTAATLLHTDIDGFKKLLAISPEIRKYVAETGIERINRSPEISGDQQMKRIQSLL